MNKIQLCKDEILDYAVRITDLYGTGDGLECISWIFGAGEGGFVTRWGDGLGDGSGDGSGENHWDCAAGDGFGKGWADGWGDGDGDGNDYSVM